MQTTCYCACNCGTIVMIGDQPQGALTERFIHDFDGTLDYIELFVEGHDRMGTRETFRSRLTPPREWLPELPDDVIIAREGAEDAMRFLNLS